MLLLRSKLCYLLPSLTSLNATSNQCLHFSALATRNPSPKPHFMVDHLVSLYGFSSDQANRASKRLAHLKSPSNPDSVLNFLKQTGFSDTQIKKTISKLPRLLCIQVDKTLKPKFSDLKETGISHSDIIKLVCENPRLLSYGDLLPKIGILRSLRVTNEDILKVLKKNRAFLSSNLTERIMPNISLLRDCGIPDHMIGKMATKSVWFFGWAPSSMKAAIEKADELGVPRCTDMFCRILHCIAGSNGATINAKFKLFESFGWSKVEVMDAFRSYPAIFLLSEKNIRDKMNFFVKEVGCELSYVVARPLLFGFSLEKRLVPRAKVLKILRREELLRGEENLMYAVRLSEKDFVKKFVLPHKEKVPGMHEAYVAAASANVHK